MPSLSDDHSVLQSLVYLLSHPLRNGSTQSGNQFRDFLVPATSQASHLTEAVNADELPCQAQRLL